MATRRTILQAALALATGSALSETATATSPSGSEQGWIPYDAGTFTGSETTVAARIAPAAVETAPIPGALAGPLGALRNQFDSLTLDTLQRVRGTLALEGDHLVGGGALIEGSIDRQAFTAELSAGSFHRVEETKTRSFYRSASAPYAIGVGEGLISVGYAPAGSPVAHATTAAEGESSTERTGRLEAIAASINEDSIAVATVGPETRTAAIDRVPSEATGFTPLLEAARGVGVGISVGESRSRVSYGLDVDPTAVSTETYWNLLSSANERATGFELGSVDRSGRTVLIRGTIPTAALWSTHRRMVGIDSG